jgi:G:T-mismatch repair DNA endonuclease (very short patch repair protein)
LQLSKQNKHLYSWYKKQQKDYENKADIMNDPFTRTVFTNMAKKYKHLCKAKKELQSSKNNTIWLNYLQEMKTELDKDIKNGGKKKITDILKHNKVLCNWAYSLIKLYTTRTKSFKRIEIVTAFEEFLSNPDYKKYFLTAEEQYMIDLENIENYITTWNKLPNKKSKNETESVLGHTLGRRMRYYKMKNKTGLMKQENLYKLFDNLVKKYKTVFGN